MSETVARYRRVLVGTQLALTGIAIAAGTAWLLAIAARLGPHLSAARLAPAAIGEAVAVALVLAAHAVFVALPLARRIAAEAHLLASRDALTGLPTRHGFDERLARALARYHRSGRRFALAYVDVDHFKRINDERGHPEGDRLLRLVAQRLRLLVRSEDDVARIGGDEFAVILEGVPDVHRANALADRLTREVARPAGGEVVPISVGVAMASFTHRDTSALVRDADGALYESKRRGRDGWTVAGPALPRARAV